jgi:mono/diheme cytochrome c family protein
VTSKLFVVVPMAVAAAVAVAVAVAVASGGAGHDPSGGSRDGRAVFQAMCASCHGADGRPPVAMTARLGVRDLTAPEFRARATPATVEQQVRTGSKPKLMPSFEGAIDDAQITAVAAYVASPQFLSPP